MRSLARHRRGAAAFAALLFLFATEGAATLYPTLTLADLAAKADAIVEVTIERKDTRWLQGGRRIATFYDARVITPVDRRENLRAGETFTFALPGGEVGEFGQVIAGVPRLEPGDRAVVFVSAPVGPTGERRVVGLGLGVFVARAQSSSSGALRFQRPALPAQIGAVAPSAAEALSLGAIRRAIAPSGTP